MQQGTTAPQAAAASSDPGTVLVRYWAGARAAAGVEQDQLDRSSTTTVQEVLAAAAELRPGLQPVLPACSVLLDGRAVPRGTALGAAGLIEVLPPFAGG
ncbi:MoaD/ThiS family protein [Arsenicicoccus sp. oral taxon 190]|uniref:MoaD/ThiS family protein n=1 Tax=Arsenicicoccus sp. oral taxon 190 TaxID=1658671 RepID=UPI00067A1FEC|nr:MoaD/ThiS family protein [Arsenicicoccus sp. oral taxon 190]AKT50302.1 hypothetical protein ADJ73_01330 [Arsenicicoccus sp. oral taxon 190]